MPSKHGSMIKAWIITSVGWFECGLELVAVPCCPYQWHNHLVCLPSHQSGASSSVTKNLPLISMTKKLEKKKLSGLSVHLQPKSGANLIVCSFSVHSLKSVWNVGWGEFRTERVLTELLYYFPSFDLKCSFTPSQKPSVFWPVWQILSTHAWGGSERVDEDGGGMQLRLPLICLFHRRLLFFQPGFEFWTCLILSWV